VQSPADYGLLLDALDRAGFAGLPHAGDAWRRGYAHANLARILAESLPG
jgi:hypothetical protein